MTFIKRVEDFVCEKCGEAVHGNGYTNHCPKCIWSKHVDNEPGDRAANCGGLMEPVFFEQDGHEMVVTHKCIKCGYKKRNKISPQDDFDQILKITQTIIDSQTR